MNFNLSRLQLIAVVVLLLLAGQALATGFYDLLQVRGPAGKAQRRRSAVQRRRSAAHLNRPCRQVSPRASTREIKRAFRRLALKYHPDRNPSPDAQWEFVRLANGALRIKL